MITVAHAAEDQEITLPYLRTGDLSVSLIMATTDQRFDALDTLMGKSGRSLAAIPDAWREQGPLSAWCWFVLVLNDIEPGDTPQPLTAYGVDLWLASSDLRKWVFFLA